MENTENKGNQHKRKFKPLKIKKTDYSYLVTIFLSLLSAFFNFSEGYLILAMFIGSLAILILSADESGCLSCFIQFGIGAIIVLGLKHHVYLLVICLVIGILIHKMLDTRCSFKIDEEGFIEIGLDIIIIHAHPADKTGFIGTHIHNITNIIITRIIYIVN